MAETELAGSAAVAGPRRRSGFRVLLVNLGIASGALSALYAGAGTILLPQQIENLDRAHKVTALGVVAGVSAAVALIFNRLAGACRTGRGRDSDAGRHG
jgi:hypothetical protein